MALLFMDGFGGGDVSSKWDPISASYTTGTAGPRVAGGYYASLTNANAGGYSKSFPAASQVFLGFGLNPVGNPLVNFYGDNGSTAHITIYRNPTTGVLEIHRGGYSGTLLASGTQGLPLSSWFYVEISVTISDTVGEVHVRLNGSATDEVSFTGDTKNGGTNTTIDRILINTGTFVEGNGTKLADLYLLNSTGPAPHNTFLGDVVVRTLSPSANGTYSQLTGSDGNQVDNYLLVDEHPYSGTDYAGSSTVGQKDTYGLTDLPGGISTVYAVQVSGFMMKSDGSLGSARYVLRTGGADYPGTTRALSTSAIGYYDLFTQNPATSAAWTPAEVSGLEAGMEVM